MIKAYLLTSVESVEGVKELILKISDMIHLTAKPATFTIGAFERVKDFILDQKESLRRQIQ
ncbi:MAG: hypothetical protein ACP5N0_01840 [Methanosarcina sp.]